MFIYGIQNKLDGKMYVGKSHDNSYRDLLRYFCAGHLKSAINNTNDRPHLENAMRKYGVENFSIFSLWSGFVTPEQLCELEKYYIKCFWTQKYGYNITHGGDGVAGRVVSGETRKRQSNARKGKFLGQDNPFFGKQHSEALKLRWSQARKGKNKGQTAWNKGLTKETSPSVMAISESKIGKPSSFRGKKHSDETRSRMKAMRSRLTYE